MALNDRDYDTDPEREALLEFLFAQRRSVLAILDGLPGTALRTSVVPSRWTPLGLVEHLTGAEFFWIQVVLLGVRGPLPPPDDSTVAGEWGPFLTDRPVSEVIEEYRRQCADTDAAVRDLPLGTRRGPGPDGWARVSP